MSSHPNNLPTIEFDLEYADGFWQLKDRTFDASKLSKGVGPQRMPACKGF